MRRHVTSTEMPLPNLKHSQRGEAALQESAFDAVGGQRESPPISLSRRGPRSEPPQHVGAGGMVEVIPVEGARAAELVDQGQPAVGALAHADRNRTVQLYDRCRVDAGELVIERRDLRPIG